MSSLLLPTESRLEERDGRYLRQAIALADRARERGNRPFGAVIVAAVVMDTYRSKRNRSKQH